ncbi:MAG: Clp protease ClpB [Candidatus Sedimenticola endophacoides]|uniref:Clp protease ClpB n=1 Tax=Candidatus Sedimenticola endophacoides TaxID=2548426 RepID=A0A657PSC1_9GAMM|nr:MAG: Clp protease ClpB [Candidatus Sedimenticola endophacoides]OQX36226.1 MAG: Clp protease ClpB [Candidatus Sedimenticola endophacoides]OQX40059.1 MAG: Clp protease ClpB [Candidatus Sedimenticola endophacoides]OQX44191.1 MAG: Clp protease ClpB [Candidatus Sedimenticola endophacoides]OQX48243.1 MAG: Clp protease ClpB [Candidatus Sedimenticola endophacoides]
MKRVLDVSMLEPCEPLERTLEAIAGLAPGDYLLVLHRRRPNLLFPLLEQAGFCWHCREGGAAGYEIFIWRQDDAAAEIGAGCDLQC